MSTHLALLWHCHQPDYRDPMTGRPFMPWVRMHALRGYRDLLLDTVQDAIPWTINVVPSLLDQLQWYADGGEDDALDVVRCDPSALAPDLWRWLPSGHPAMTRAHPPYAALRARLEAGEALSVGDVRDLQVWSVLAWFGATALRDHPVLRELRAKGSSFDEGDKETMLGVQRSILREIPSLLRRLGETPGACISCSPYYHPILPLLIDARSARRAMPHLPDDVRFAHPEDALRQLLDARLRTEEAVGRKIIGLWPSEGSVSPEVVSLAAESGYRWLATDRQVLERSDVTRTSARPGRFSLGYGVDGWFRSTELSDRIGFWYADWSAVAAVDDLLAETARIGQGGTVLVALDGENPWESYTDAGEAFRRALVEQTRAREGVTLVGLDAACQQEAVGTVHTLHTGSWIGADFAIWAGHPEDRDAWRALAEVRAEVERSPSEARQRAMRHVLAAEGSDWFWWYGEEFETPWGGHFDALFRAHLAAAWRALGMPVPEALSKPIRRPRLPGRTDPVRILPIDPATVSQWASWHGAGEVRPRQGSMAAFGGVQGLSFGWSADGSLWIRVKLARKGFSLEPAPQQLFVLSDGLAARYEASDVTLSVLDSAQGAEAAGAVRRWPDQPLHLAAPEDLHRTWWDV